MTSAPPRCYVACALGGSVSKTADAIDAIAKEAGWRPYLPHRDTATPRDDAPPGDVLMKNLAAIFTSDCVVAETGPSLGVGIELLWARMAKKRVILLNREGRFVSRMVTGLLPDAMMITYRTLDEVRGRLTVALRDIESQLSAGKRQGLLVVLEGRDAVGKTETARGLVSALKEAGFQAEGAKDPPRLEPWSSLREQFERGKDVDLLAEAVTLVAARVDNTRRVISPLLESGTTVILDRYFLSWLAYQEIQLEPIFPDATERRQWLVLLNGLASSEESILQPDLTVYLEVSDEERRKRRGSRSDPESKYDTDAVQTAVVRGYDTYSIFAKAEIHRIDTSSKTPQEVIAHLRDIIVMRLSSSSPQTAR
jgi:dTMP kinase